MTLTKYKQRKCPRFSACGLNCGLCHRYYTTGTSKCPDCLGADFLTKPPKCSVLSCSQNRELDEKMSILSKLLSKYDDGRRKNFFCTAINLLELPDIKMVMMHLNLKHVQIIL